MGTHATGIAYCDVGNEIVKAINGTGHEISYVHAIQPISLTELEKHRQRSAKSSRRGKSDVGPLAPGFVKVNGQGYVIGERAERYAVIKNTRKTGASRYNKDYYGVLVAATLPMLFRADKVDVAFYGSHSPKDSIYRDDLMDSALGKWEVESANGAQTFRIIAAQAFDEPMCGLMRRILREDGKGFARTALLKGDTLVIDIGGLTVDMVFIGAGAEFDPDAYISEDGGIISVIDALEDAIKATHSARFKNAGHLGKHRLRYAIRNGIYRAGGHGEIGCSEEVEQAIMPLLNQISNNFSRFGGPTEYDTIFLTGGGSGALYSHLIPILDHNNVILADPDEETIHMANVRGMSQLARWYSHQGKM